MSEEYKTVSLTILSAYKNHKADLHGISNCSDKDKLGKSSFQSVYKDDNSVGRIYFPQNSDKTRMWANAQPDGRPAEHRWRPLFNAAKFG